MIKELLDMIYPRRCPICGDIVVPKDKKACPKCVKELLTIKEPRCKRCSKPIENEEKEYCYDCETKHFTYKEGYALWLYDKRMRKSIADFKFHNRKEYADFYVEEYLRNYSDVLRKIGADALLPIPIHKSKLRTRGYNQAEILAKKIGKELDILVVCDLLIRDKKTLPQKGLNDKERLKNLLHAFSVDKEKMKGYTKVKKVILVDDIYTTGSTIEACTKVLLQNGIWEVYFMSLCIGKGY